MKPPPLVDILIYLLFTYSWPYALVLFFLIFYCYTPYPGVMHMLYLYMTPTPHHLSLMLILNLRCMRIMCVHTVTFVYCLPYIYVCVYMCVLVYILACHAHRYRAGQAYT